MIFCFPEIPTQIIQNPETVLRETSFCEVEIQIAIPSDGN
jgi:hypothetical protein